MTPPTYIPATRTVRAKCLHCDGAFSVYQNHNQQAIQLSEPYPVGTKVLTHVAYMLFVCPGCGHGALGIVRFIGNMSDQGETQLVGFYPFATEAAPLPKDVPADIEAEFREAELCAAASARRAASALLRSTLEKTLKANGYTSGGLYQKIEEAAKDGVITAPRKERAHAEVRVLGNDVLHDAYRPVDSAEVTLAHLYTQRILEDFYDDRPTTLAVLATKGRVPAAAAPAAAGGTTP